MNSSFLIALGVAAFLCIAPAHAQTNDTSPLPAPQPGVDTNAPLPGANSFTEAQVKERLEKNGFSQVSELKLDDQGIWRGKAMQGQQALQVAVDYRGNITYSGTIAAEDNKS
jgi:hypothetical protein